LSYKRKESGESRKEDWIEQSDNFVVVQQNDFATKMSYSVESNQLAYQLTNLIRTSLNAQAMLSGIARVVGQTLEADVCSVVRGTSPRPQIQVGFWNREDSSEIPFEITRQFFSHPVVREILAKTEPLEISDLQTAQEQSASSWLEAMPVRALLGAATYFQGNANGIIMVGYFHPHQWTATEQEFLQVAAEVSAIACYIAQLEKVTKVNPNKESIFNTAKTSSFEGGQLFKKWYELTHQQLEQQRQLNQLKDEIITAISDRARNPLASMKLAMEMLSRDRSQPLPPESQARYWDILQQEWQRLNDLINNIVTLKKLESHEVSYNPESVTLKPLISELARSFQEQWQEDKRKQLTLVVEETDSKSPVTLYTDPQHLRNILNELLINAGNFSLPGTTVSLRVTVEQGQVAIALINLGRGISPQEQAYIFEPFRRGEGAIEQSIPGVGLGLSLVKKLVELLNGTIEVASNPTDNPEAYVTSFTLILPQQT
jgi:signal transduction histidine kinase